MTGYGQAVGDGPVRACMMRRLGGTRPGRLRAHNAFAVGDTGEGKAIEKSLRTVRPCDTLPLSTGPQQIEPHAAAPLGNDEKHPVVLRADGHFVFRPSV